MHTGQDSSYPARILYEATGVPYVILAAVSDANGPRLTIGFTSSHYEFTELYGGQRQTDEKWQENFTSAMTLTMRTTTPIPPLGQKKIPGTRRCLT